MNGIMKVMGNVKNHAGAYWTALEYAKAVFNTVIAYIRGWMVILVLLIMVGFQSKETMDELYVRQQEFFLNINTITILLFFMMELADTVLCRHENHVKYYRFVRIISFLLLAGCVSLYGSRCATPFSSLFPEYFLSIVGALIVMANVLILFGRVVERCESMEVQESNGME